MPPYRRKPAHEKTEKKLTYKEYCHKTLCNWPGGIQPTKDMITGNETPKPIILPTYKMPSGEFAGKCLHQVPSWYLIWVYKHNRCNADVRSYLEMHLETLTKHLRYPVK